MESFVLGKPLWNLIDYPADCVDLRAWPKQWFSTLHGSERTDAEPVMV